MQEHPTTDLAWDGHALIYENGELLAEAERFANHEQMITGDIDLERLLQDRMRMTSFNDSATDCRERVQALRRIPFEFRVPEEQIPLQRRIARFPYVPSNPRERDDRCYEAYNIQVHGLLKRLASTGTQRVVIGVSGGLDSTQALIVCARAMDELKLPRANILAYTMPGYATSSRTRNQAWQLMRAIGATKLDHAFTDLERGSDGLARVELTADGRQATLWADESYPYLMVFTGDTLPDGRRRSLAVEPMTCAPNAFRSGDGLVRLEPEQTHTGSWGIAPVAGPVD